MSHCKEGCRWRDASGCGYANDAAGRKAVLTTTCDKYGIPHEFSRTLGREALEKHGCPCYEPGRVQKKTKAADAPKASGRERKRFVGLDLEKAREMYEAGEPDTRIAAALGCSNNTILNWRRSNGLRSRNRREINWEPAMELYRDKKTDAEIAAALGCCRYSVREWRKRHGLDANNKRGVWK